MLIHNKADLTKNKKIKNLKKSNTSKKFNPNLIYRSRPKTIKQTPVLNFFFLLRYLKMKQR